MLVAQGRWLKYFPKAHVPQGTTILKSTIENSCMGKRDIEKNF
jgi:hypothetical protein